MVNRRQSRTEYQPKEVVEGKLLACLEDDGGKVAIVVNQDDLTRLIRALGTSETESEDQDDWRRSFILDLHKLRQGAFGQ